MIRKADLIIEKGAHITASDENLIMKNSHKMSRRAGGVAQQGLRRRAPDPGVLVRGNPETPGSNPGAPTLTA